MAKRDVKVETPGDESADASAAPETGAEGGEDTKTAPEIAQARALAAGALPDESDVDPDALPFGTRKLTKQGWVVSTKPDPRQLPK